MRIKDTMKRGMVSRLAGKPNDPLVSYINISGIYNSANQFRQYYKLIRWSPASYFFKNGESGTF